MRATQSIKKQLMRRYGWNGIRHDRKGNWWVRESLLVNNRRKNRWLTQPLWADEDIQEYINEGEINP